MVKKDLNISLPTRVPKKLDRYVYFSQNWAHVEETDETKYMPLLIKDDELL